MFHLVSVFVRAFNLISMESLELIVAQFSWHSWVSLPHEFKSSTKTNLPVESVIFLTETESQRIQKITSTWKSKKHMKIGSRI